jgi:hypothetical protein
MQPDDSDDLMKIKIGTAALLLLVGIHLPAAQPAAPTRAATAAYRNPQWGFCVNHPRAWAAEEAPDKDSVVLNPLPRVSPQVVHGQIVIAAFHNIRHEPGGGPKSWDEVLDDEMDALQDNAMQNVKSTRAQAAPVLGYPGFLSEVQYDDEGVHWLRKEARLARRDGVVLEVKLMCPAEECSRLEPEFDRLLAGGFKPVCSE